MKIVDRATFLSMPRGTVFSSYRREKDNHGFGPGDSLQIKVDTWIFEASNDFIVAPLFPLAWIEPATGQSVDCGYVTGITDAGEACGLFEGTETEITPDYTQTYRDGLFDDDWYMIYSPSDVRALISRLEQALRDSGEAS